jgi:hypothetical protein
VTLDIFNTDTLSCEYVDYLSKVRKLMPNTITAHLSCIINVIKYNFREDWSALDSCKVVMSCIILRDVKYLVRRLIHFFLKFVLSVCTLCSTNVNFSFLNELFCTRVILLEY